MIAPLKIPADFPPHTRTWLQYIDAACAVRAVRDKRTKLEEAIELRAHATGNTAYFAGLYIEQLEGRS